MQQRIESTVGLAEPGASAVADAFFRLGAVMPTKGEPAQAAGHSETTPLVGKLVIQPLTPAQRRRRIAFKVAGVLSLLLHAGSLLAFLNWRGVEMGAVEQPSDAISVELVESRTLEALQPKQIPEPTPSPEATAPAEGKSDAFNTVVPRTDPTPESESEPEVVEPPPPVVVPEAAEDTSRTAKQDVPEATGAPPMPVAGPAEVVPPPPKAKAAADDAAAQREEPKRIEKKAAQRAPKGGVTSKASAGKGTGGERASASSGSLLSYAAHVRARVAGNKPSGGGLRGTAVVSFGVTTSGGLAFASVARSSGNSTLDELAIAAVRGAAPFPTPPAGATSAQLRFTIPFYFE